MINKPATLKQPLFEHIYLLADELSQANHRFIQNKTAKSNDRQLCKPRHLWRFEPS
ncbi:hypothetical protein HA075_16185 [bacterium BFN5]|nr:hypothetical protein HA075_16185 [bacterium BFN5]